MSEKPIVSSRDMAEARRVFAEMGVTGWNECAGSIEA